MSSLWPVAYGALLAAVVIRTFWADTDLRAAAFVFSVDWLAANLSRWLVPLDYRGFFVPSDLILATLFFVAWLIRSHVWLSVIFALYVISGLTGVIAAGPGSKYSFDLALNAAFLARLAVVWIASFEPRTAQERA